MIEFRELSFKYKGGGNYSLKDINLIVKKENAFFYVVGVVVESLLY